MGVWLILKPKVKLLLRVKSLFGVVLGADRSFLWLLFVFFTDGVNAAGRIRLVDCLVGQSTGLKFMLLFYPFRCYFS